MRQWKLISTVDASNKEVWGTDPWTSLDVRCFPIERYCRMETGKKPKRPLEPLEK